MFQTRIIAVLCLALGAVPAESFAQAPILKLRIASECMTPGGSLPCTLDWTSPSQATVTIFMGVQSGITSVSVGTQEFLIPLDSATVVVATAQASHGSWSGSLTIPFDPSLVGQTANAVGVVTFSSGQVLMSPVVPFGPIIEDSIN